ncbi:MAG: SDR family oxidoreductase [Anaerolineaceae bacterium]|nr:SDR family oxidoreductase [Anaerolineaceae bacterium]
MRLNLTDQVAIVTGGAHRVGRAIALELARQGVHILVHYNSSADAATDTAREIKSQGVEAYTVQADISQPEGVEQVFATLGEKFGRLHILVNSAANFQQRDLLDVSIQDWQTTLNINLTAPFLLTQAAVAVMRQNAPSGGSIVNILDKGAVMPWAKYPHHSVSKAALHMLTLVSAASLGPDIRVNGVIPGPVMKPAGTSMNDEEWARIGQRVALQRTGSPEDVARAVVYLTSEDFITGAILPVNGGEHLE